MKTPKNKSKKNDPQKFNQALSNPTLGEKLAKISNAVVFWSFVSIVTGFIFNIMGWTVIGGITLIIGFPALLTSIFVSLFFTGGNDRGC